MLEDRDIVRVVMSNHDKNGEYSIHTGVAITSIFANTKSKVQVYILHDETLTDDNRRRFLKLAEDWGQTISFVMVNDFIEGLKCDVDRLTRHFSRGSLYRLFIPDLLDVDRVIYLDSDMVVAMDIRDYWEHPMGDSVAVAVHDMALTTEVSEDRCHIFFAERYLGVPKALYFNSGSMMINLKAMRESYDIGGQLESFLCKYSRVLSFPDQDFLNGLFRGKVLLADKRYNMFVGFYLCGKDELYGKIWHYCGSEKPWVMSGGSNEHIYDLYWKYIRLSPWRDKEGMLVDRIEVPTHEERVKRDVMGKIRTLSLLKMAFKRSMSYELEGEHGSLGLKDLFGELQRRYAFKRYEYKRRSSLYLLNYNVRCLVGLLRFRVKNILGN